MKFLFPGKTCKLRTVWTTKKTKRSIVTKNQVQSCIHPDPEQTHVVRMSRHRIESKRGCKLHHRANASAQSTTHGRVRITYARLVVQHKWNDFLFVVTTTDLAIQAFCKNRRKKKIRATFSLGHPRRDENVDTRCHPFHWSFGPDLWWTSWCQRWRRILRREEKAHDALHVP